MIALSVNITDSASPALQKIIGALTGSQMAELNERGGRGAVNAAISYHREFDQSGGWKGKRYLGPSNGDGSGFGADVARGWFFKEADAGGATISNNADYYAFKVRGGTITPKRAKYLTIPLIHESRGLYASVYQQNTGRKLFRPKGKNVLMEKLEDGSIRAVYALKESVSMGPWTGALPPEEMLTDSYKENFSEGLEEIIEEA